MGSYIEINDTLQITKKQRFPNELDWKKHLKAPYITEQFADNKIELFEKIYM